MDLKQLKEDFDRLDKPLVGGVYNLCYGDGYYAKSLVAKYGKSLGELREILNCECWHQVHNPHCPVHRKESNDNSIH